MPHEQTIIQRCQAGDSEAFAVLFKQYRRRLYCLAATTLQDQAAAEDVVQETFLAVLQNTDTYRRHAAFETWRTAIAVNQCRSHLRRQKVHQALSLDNLTPGWMARVAGAEPDPAAVVAAPGATPDSFYLLHLGGRADDPIQLYHADTGLVETLPYRRHAWPPFSPDHQWLLLRELASNDIWMRPVADVGGEWRLLATEVVNIRWIAALTEVALGRSWQTFPEGELIGERSTRPFETRPDGWSSEGRFLVVTGLMIGRYDQALFLLSRN